MLRQEDLPRTLKGFKMPRRTEPKGAHKALLILVEECEIEWKLAGDRIGQAKARVETARKALELYEKALAEETSKKTSNRLQSVA